jgi:hypothetical protein
MKRMLSALTLVLLAAATAATAAADDDVRSKPLTLHLPAPAARALKYALLPELSDTTPGNAVVHYRLAIVNMKQDAPPSRDWYPMFDRWLAAPLKDLPRKEMGEFLKQCETTFQEVDAGARSEQCDWGLTEELRKKGYATLLPDVQEMRAIAALLPVRIRFELAEGRLDKAVRAMQTGFAMARHVADAPTLISALVGLAISAIMIERLEEVLQQPEAPDFYWALTDLPRPFIDLRKPMQGERVGVYGSFPGAAEMAADLNAKPWTPEQVDKVVMVFKEFADQGNDFQQVKEEAVILLRLAARHESAKKMLIDQGRPKELVDAMPHIQVGLLVALQQYDEQFDELLKWQSLPFWEAQPGMMKAQERVKDLQNIKDGPAIPLAKAMLPAVMKVFGAQTRIDRRIAALRCVEAVRLHTAAQDGKFPSSLDEIKEVPVPTDPVDGKPFGYRVVGDRAFFSSTPFPGQAVGNFNTPTYELIWKP